MTKRKTSARKTTTKKNRPPRATGQVPAPKELVRQADITTFASVRFDCEMFIRVTNPEFMPHEVMALVKQGQVQLDPIAPGEVGTLILEGFPYTVLGYYTFLEQDSDYEIGPDDCSFHGPFYDFYADRNDTIQAMVNATAEEFEQVRQTTREMREELARTAPARPKKAARR